MKHDVYFCNITFGAHETFHKSKSMKEEQKSCTLVKSSKLKKLVFSISGKWRCFVLWESRNMILFYKPTTDYEHNLLSYCFGKHVCPSFFNSSWKGISFFFPSNVIKTYFIVLLCSRHLSISQWIFNSLNNSANLKLLVASAWFWHIPLS